MKAEKRGHLPKITQHQDHGQTVSLPVHSQELHLRGFSESKCAQDRKILTPEVPVETHNMGGAKEQQIVNRTKCRSLASRKITDQSGFRIPSHGKKAPGQCLIT